MSSSWPWPEDLEGAIAAPPSHRVLLETSRVRVLEVVIDAGVREPEHTHQHPGVITVDRPARIRYFTQGTPTFESDPTDEEDAQVRTLWMDREGPHAVENIDDRPCHAFRVELLDR